MTFSIFSAIIRTYRPAAASGAAGLAVLIGCAGCGATTRAPSSPKSKPTPEAQVASAVVSLYTSAATGDYSRACAELDPQAQQEVIKLGDFKLMTTTGGGGFGGQNSGYTCVTGMKEAVTTDGTGTYQALKFVRVVNVVVRGRDAEVDIAASPNTTGTETLHNDGSGWRIIGTPVAFSTASYELTSGG